MASRVMGLGLIKVVYLLSVSCPAVLTTMSTADDLICALVSVFEVTMDAKTTKDINTFNMYN